MPAIFAEVDRKYIRAAQFGEHRRSNGVWFIRFASLAKGRNVVDVDAEFGHFFS
jgi:hypothetical protein